MSLAPPPAPPADGARTITRAVPVIVPDLAKVGDRLSFMTPAGSFSLTVPQGATAGKSMNVSLPIPAHFPAHRQLTISNMKLNNEPIPLKYSSEMVAIMSEHRQRMEMHWSRFPSNERHRLRLIVDLAHYKPQAKALVPCQLGFWKTQRPAHRVDAVAGWEPNMPRALKSESFVFAGLRWQLIVQGTARPWRTMASSTSAEQQGSDLELGVLLRRVQIAPGEASAAISIFTLLEIADRWSSWKTVSLGPGEDYYFDLGDRRKIVDVTQWSNSMLEVNLMQLRSMQPTRLCSTRPRSKWLNMLYSIPSYSKP
ncbi:MAG: hypothetical protein SGPRY_009113 [Prymnesium sp.]